MTIDEIRLNVCLGIAATNGVYERYKNILILAEALGVSPSMDEFMDWVDSDTHPLTMHQLASGFNTLLEKVYPGYTELAKEQNLLFGAISGDQKWVDVDLHPDILKGEINDGVNYFIRLNFNFADEKTLTVFKRSKKEADVIQTFKSSNFDESAMLIEKIIPYFNQTEYRYDDDHRPEFTDRLSMTKYIDAIINPGLEFITYRELISTLGSIKTISEFNKKFKGMACSYRLLDVWRELREFMELNPDTEIHDFMSEQPNNIYHSRFRPDVVLGIVAVGVDNNLIGLENGNLPWKSKDDMKIFRSHSGGSVVIMGRTTFKTIGNKGLPGRFNIVVGDASKIENPQGLVHIVPTIQDAYLLAKQVICLSSNTGVVSVIGGSKIYESFLDAGLIDEFLISYIAVDPSTTINEKCAFFPMDKIEGKFVMKAELVNKNEDDPLVTTKLFVKE